MKTILENWRGVQDRFLFSLEKNNASPPRQSPLRVRRFLLALTYSRVGECYCFGFSSAINPRTSSLGAIRRGKPPFTIRVRFSPFFNCSNSYWLLIEFKEVD